MIKKLRFKYLFYSLLFSLNSFANFFSENNIKHIAILCDGNRRWAKKNNYLRAYGHEYGFHKVLPELISFSFENGLQELSLSMFSTLNWRRSAEELKDLMTTYNKFLDEYLPAIIKKYKIRVIHWGRKDLLGQEMISKLEKLEFETMNNRGGILNLGLDYDGRDELIRAAKKFMQLPKSEQNAEDFYKYLETNKYSKSEPQIIIRTGDVQRLSGFMPYQAAYAELFFLKKLFPELTTEDLRNIALEYKNNRPRRNGK